ncbi:MAG: Sjogren's syndrome/scleroderma autoantigen 1 family protein [Methanoregulaceae archaeon]
MTQGKNARKPDDIMAEYLLRGGKMLAKTCPACGSPLFEYKGETRCVVCAEQEKPGEDQKRAATDQKPSTATGPVPAQAPADYPALEAGISETVLNLCERVQAERDPKAVRILMESIALGMEALRTLRRN